MMATVHPGSRDVDSDVPGRWEFHERLQARDRAAWSELYMTHHGRLSRYLRAFAPNSCEDLAQEVWLKAFDHIDGFDVSKPIWPWIKAIAANHARTSHRRARPGQVVAIDDPDSFSSEIPSVDAKLDEGRLRQAMRDCVSLLPRGERRAIELGLNDCTVEECARDLAIDSGAFHVRVHRARAKLRECLAKKGYKGHK